MQDAWLLLVLLALLALWFCEPKVAVGVSLGYVVSGLAVRNDAVMQDAGRWRLQQMNPG